MRRYNNDAPVSDFDLRAFQSEVFDDLERMRATVSIANFPPKNDVSLKGLDSGLFARAMLAFFSFLGKRAKTSIINNKDFIKKDRVAKRIVFDPRIKKVLCPSLKTDLGSNLFEVGVRVRLVEIVTSRLTEDRITKEFAIEKDARLFSLMVLKILQVGITDYCK